jgi:hypothetical protein
MSRLLPPDLTGERFGRLTIQGPAPDLPGYWSARCACGRELAAPREGFVSGRITSCGRPPAGTGAAQATELTARAPTPRWS